MKKVFDAISTAVVAVGVILGFSNSGSAQQFAAVTTSPPTMATTASWPPLEQYIPSQSENGEYDFVLRFHANGTFDYNVAATGGKYAGYTYNPSWSGQPPLTGRWWRGDEAKGVFCFSPDTGPSRGKTTCKTGRLMGKVALDGTRLRDPAK